MALFHGRIFSPPPTDLSGSIGETLFTLLPVAFGAAGALVAQRRRTNPIGWILCIGMLLLTTRYWVIVLALQQVLLPLLREPMWRSSPH